MDSRVWLSPAILFHLKVVVFMTAVLSPVKDDQEDEGRDEEYSQGFEHEKSQEHSRGYFQDAGVGSLMVRLLGAWRPPAWPASPAQAASHDRHRERLLR